MKFAKEFLQQLDDEPTAEIVEDIITDNSRWSIHHRRVFKFEDKFYLTHYSVGATEMQDEQPYEYDSDEIECPEVREVAKLMKAYEVIK